MSEIPEIHYARNGDVALAFEDAGKHKLKGVPGRGQRYRVVT